MKGELNIFEEAKRDNRRKEIDKFIDHSHPEDKFSKENARMNTSGSGTNDRMAVVMGEQL